MGCSCGITSCIANGARSGRRSVGDASACAVKTERIRLGAMITPLARRRPWKVARETATLDLLSGGRVVFGAALGSPTRGGVRGVRRGGRRPATGGAAGRRRSRSSPGCGAASGSPTAASTSGSTRCGSSRSRRRRGSQSGSEATGRIAARSSARHGGTGSFRRRSGNELPSTRGRSGGARVHRRAAGGCDRSSRRRPFDVVIGGVTAAAGRRGSRDHPRVRGGGCDVVDGAIPPRAALAEEARRRVAAGPAAER